MTDTTSSSAEITAPDHEDPAAITDYHEAHLAEVARNNLRDTLAALIARGVFGDLTTKDGLPVGDETVSSFGRDQFLGAAEFTINAGLLNITLADAS